MSKKTYERAMSVCRCIDSNDCTLDAVEKKWHRCFNGILKSFGFPKKTRKRLWDELVLGNWDRLHLTTDEKARTPEEWLEKFYYDVSYCSDRWSIDRLTRCHWLFRQYKDTTERSAK